MRRVRWWWLLLPVLFACAAPANPSPSRPKVVATISILADLVSQVAGDRVEVVSLLPVGGDPHTYEPVPKDLQKVAESRDVQEVAESQLVFYNGLGLEKWLEELIENAGGRHTSVELTRGLRSAVETEGRYQGEPDPHLWMDPVFATHYVENAREALVAFDPEGRATYEANAARVIQELDALHTWIQEQVALIPPHRRKLVTTHDAFRYFGERYGFKVVGTIWGISTEDEPSAQEIARLVDGIREEGVPAVFVESTINPKLMEQVAREAGVRIGEELYGDSLGPPGSDADTYVKMMRHNVRAIVEALR